MQCLQYVFFSFLSLQKYKIHVKGYHSKPSPDSEKSLPRRTASPVLKFLDPPQNLTNYEISNKAMNIGEKTGKKNNLELILKQSKCI